jgi:hypothetical protein
VAVLATDSLINIADKVVDAIKSDFTIIKKLLVYKKTFDFCKNMYYYGI